MAEEKSKMKKKIEGKAAKLKKELAEEKEEKMEEVKVGKMEEKTEKKEIKKVQKKEEFKPKDKAVANGFSLRISPKQAIAICKVIRGKSPEAAIERLEAVVAGKRAIPMANLEVAHQKGKGLAGAKYPRNACLAIINVVKQVGANAVVNGIENPVITIAKADQASAPYRRAGRKAKRTHIHIEVMARSQGVPIKSNKTKLIEKKNKMINKNAEELD
jgi:ribosomal protein L22